MIPTKVFIINKGAHDHSAARKYGEIVYLSKGTLSKYATGRMFRQFTAVLANSTEDDYILLTSLTVMCVIACAIFALKHERLNLLLYKDDSYVVRKLLLKGDENEQEADV